jgi:hypothetical protein
MLCRREWGHWKLEGKGGGGRSGQLASSKGPARMGIRYHGQGAPIPNKGFSFIHEHVPYVSL